MIVKSEHDKDSKVLKREAGPPASAGARLVAGAPSGVIKVIAKR